MSDLFGNHIVGFPTRRLKCHLVRKGQGADAIPAEVYKVGGLPKAEKKLT